MRTIIDLVLDECFFNSGIRKYIQWNYNKFPHMVIFGSTGSGKTYLLKIILGRIGLHIPNAELIICDYKSDEDFTFLNDTNDFYRFDDCMNGLDYALQILQTRQKGISSDKHFVCLVFDEWASFINNLDKKTGDAAKQKLATLLMLGRSFNVHVIISQQRLDASYFNSARDNFSVVIGMGVLSKESIEMMFSEYKDVLIRSKEQGHGSMIIGNQLREIIVPTVKDVDKLHNAILSVVHRPEDENL